MFRVIDMEWKNPTISFKWKEGEKIFSSSINVPRETKDDKGNPLPGFVPDREKPLLRHFIEKCIKNFQKIRNKE